MPINTITDERLEEITAQLDFAQKEYLRQHGWEYSSGYPGSYWMWSKTIPESGVKGVTWHTGMFVMNTELAIRTQRALNAWFDREDHERDE